MCVCVWAETESEAQRAGGGCTSRPPGRKKTLFEPAGFSPETLVSSPTAAG